ncbi:MAG: hypothetical protein QG621_695 [Patescibacteria group bacterium]|nr:hypothetical protein [Patescibacteria group bacterium]
MAKGQKAPLEEYALAITRWVGSLPSIVVHTLAFLSCFLLVALGVLPFDRMLLILTTVVSLEAIYLSIFIQMSINYTTRSIEVVEQNIDEIQEDIDEIQEDVDEIQKDVDEIQEDVDEIQEDVDEISSTKGTTTP